MADAELLITPDIARSGITRTIKTLDDTFKRLSKQAERELADAISNEVGSSMSTLRRSMGQGAASRAARQAGDPSRIAGGLVSLLAAGLLDETSCTGISEGTALNHPEAPTAVQERAAACATGLTDVQIAQFALDMAKAGMVGRAELSQLLMALGTSVSQAEFAGSLIQTECAKLRPEERIGAVLASIGNLPQQEQRNWLAQLDVDDLSAGALMMFLEQKRKASATGKLRAQEIFGAAGLAVASAETNGAMIATEQALTLAAHSCQHQPGQHHQPLATMNLPHPDLGAYLGVQGGNLQRQHSLIEKFQQQLGTANTAQASLQEAMVALVGNTAATIVKLNEILAKMGDPVQAARQQAENEALQATRTQAHYVTGNTSPLSPISSLAYSPRGR